MKPETKEKIINILIHMLVLLIIVLAPILVLKEMNRDFVFCKDKPDNTLIMLPDKSTISCGELRAINTSLSCGELKAINTTLASQLKIRGF